MTQHTPEQSRIEWRTVGYDRLGRPVREPRPGARPGTPTIVVGRFPRSALRNRKSQVAPGLVAYTVVILAAGCLLGLAIAAAAGVGADP